MLYPHEDLFYKKNHNRSKAGAGACILDHSMRKSRVPDLLPVFLSISIKNNKS